MIFRALAKIFYTFLVLIETLVSIRFVFELIGASDHNAIVRAVYEFSGVFVEPFVGIVNGDWHIGAFYVDVNALVSLAVYMMLAFVVLEVIKVFTPRFQD